MRKTCKSSLSRSIQLIFLVFIFLAWNIFSAFPASSNPQSPSADEPQISFPDASGVVNLQKDYGAKGDGVSDDTAALQAALNAFPASDKILYLPNGTYKITRTLTWPQEKLGADRQGQNTILQGQSQSGVILQLPDHTSGYTDSAHPKALLTMGPAPAYHYRNALRNLTIDTGHNNPGAIAVQFNASQQGTLRQVTIRSADNQGAIGLDLSYTDEIGPLLVSGVTVLGYQYGIKAGHTVNSQTFEHVILKQQQHCGLYNAGQSLSVRDLQSQNHVPALCNLTGDSHLVVLDSTLKGEQNANQVPAIDNQGVLFARNISTSGYEQAIHSTSGGNVSGPKVQEYVTHSPFALFKTDPHSLNLPIQETPTVPWDDVSIWANVKDFGAVPNSGQDASTAIQSAIDSGATTVYLPNGDYTINATVIIRNKVRRIIGTEASLEIAANIPVGFKLVDGDNFAPVVVFERFDGGATATPTVQNDSKRTLVMQDDANVSGNMTGPGDVYLEDISSNPSQHWDFHHQHTWARQLNVTTQGTHITNDGGTLWVLGLHAECGGTLVETTNGGQTEILGGLSYTTTDPGTAPMFVTTESNTSISLRETNYAGTPFQTLVKETQGGQSKALKRGQTPDVTFGSDLPLYVSRTATASPQPTATTLSATATATASVATATATSGTTPVPTDTPTATPVLVIPTPTPTPVPPPPTPQPLPGPLFFSTGFEDGQPQLAWNNTPSSIANIGGVCCGLTGPELWVTSGQGFGNKALLYSGYDASGSVSYAYMQAFDFSSVNITVNSGTRLSYWIYPQSSASTNIVSGSNSTCVSIDLVFSDGTRSRDLGITDQNGNRLHPAYQCNHLQLDTWNYVTTTLGPANGKRIIRLDVGYDQGPNTGGYRGFIDNITISN